MNFHRAARSGVIGMLCASILSGCGGFGNGWSGMHNARGTLPVTPTAAGSETFTVERAAAPQEDPRPARGSSSAPRYFRSSTCMVSDPSTRRILARSAWAWLEAATEPSSCLAIASDFASPPSSAAQFL